MASAGVGAQTFTFQLSSKLSEKTSDTEQYRLQLTPSVNVPFTAQPRCQLDQFAFTATTVNVDKTLYDNDTVVFNWSPFVQNDDADGVERHPKSYTLTIPKGSYTLSTLEETIARLLYQRTNTRDEQSDVNQFVSKSSGLFYDMNLLATAQPSPSETGTVFKCKTAVVSTSKDEDKTRAIQVKGIVGQHFVGGRLDDPAGVSVLSEMPVIMRVTVDTTDASAPVSTVTFDRYVAVHGAANSLAYAVDADVTLYGPATLCADDAVASLPSSQVVDAVDHLGFGMGSVAYPALTPTSGWGTAVTMDELTMIAHTAGASANTVAPDRAHATADPETGELLETPQNQRSIKPITLVNDPITHKVRAVVAIPLVKLVAEGSTLFKGMLGYDTFARSGVDADADPTSGLLPPSYQSMLQLSESASGKARVTMDPWTADNPARIVRTQAIEFHCPTLINTSYDQHGRQSGGSLASIPIREPGKVQVWQAQYDNSLPIGYHGGVIDSLTFSLTDQDGEAVDLQGSDFNATLRISWPDPVPPALGSAGAEAEDAYGLRDVKYIR